MFINLVHVKTVDCNIYTRELILVEIAINYYVL